MNKSKKILIGAAVSGILSVGLVASVSAASSSKETGKCMGANSCKGKSACGANKCKSANGCSQNGCAGPNGCGGKKNACKGEGFTITTKANCDQIKNLKKNKDKNIYFVPNETSADNSAVDDAPKKESPAAVKSDDTEKDPHELDQSNS